MRPKQILTNGAQHAATTTFSRLLCDVDPRCLYFFEPDHVINPSNVSADNLLALLRCDLNRSMISSWASLPTLWTDGAQCHDWRGDYHSHCSSSFEHCSSCAIASALALLGPAHCVCSVPRSIRPSSPPISLSLSSRPSECSALQQQCELSPVSERRNQSAQHAAPMLR